MNSSYYKNLLTGLVVAIAATVGSTAVQADTKIRTSSFDYSATTGLLIKEVIEPDFANDCLQTTYTYDAYGNRNTASSTACAGATGYAISSAGTPRTSSTDYNAFSPVVGGTTYTVAVGTFPTLAKNALLHQETRTYDPRFGGVLQMTGPNGLVTSWQYDSFGRKIQENRADGTYTTWAYRLCTDTIAPLPACPGAIGGIASSWVVITQDYAANATVNGPEKRVFYDNLNRELRSQTASFDGTVVVQDTQYDAQGRVASKSNLYASGGTAVSTTFAYDELGRVTQQSVPDTDAPTASTATTMVTYNGLTTIVADPKGQTRTTVKNAQGQSASVTDHLGGVITYTYDALGNLTQTTVGIATDTSVTTMTYNQRGQKTGMNDPAMGAWVYAYNAFGELVYQRDSLNQVTTMAYDVLGRMTGRSEPDLVSNWSFDTKFDTTACGLGKGKLCEAKTTAGYNRVHHYDSLGRPDSTVTVLASAATPSTVSVGYDSNTGRMNSKTWPSGLQATYSYNSRGYLSSVATVTSTGFPQQVKYDVLAMNVRGQVTQYRYGNAAGSQVTTVNTYNDTTSRLATSVATKDGASAGNVFSQSYQYDALNNVTARADNVTTAQELFTYDALSRLTKYQIQSTVVSSIQTTQVLYDARGNIKYKSDVGSYWYDAARPNRMTNITLVTAPGATYPVTGTRALSYAFDDYRSSAQSVNGLTIGNGNLEYTASLDNVSGRHTVRYETYTSFNMPSGITYGNLSSGTCPAGYVVVVNTETCVKTTTVAATVTYTCASGYTLSGTNCSKLNTTAATLNYSCSSGTLSGTNCVSTSTTGATPSYSCPAGYFSSTTPGGQAACAKTVTLAEVGGACPAAPSGTTFLSFVDFGGTGENSSGTGNCFVTRLVAYSCTAPATLSGTNCITTTTVAATQYYTCSTGTLVGATCQTTTTVAATPNYSCQAGQTLTGTNCLIPQGIYAPMNTASVADRTLNFVYGPEHQRVKESIALSGNGTSAYFSGNTWYLNGEDSLGLTYEKEVRDNGMTLERHYVSAGGFVFAQITKESGTGAGANKTRYFHYDQLGSIAVISDETGTEKERLAYDPWGKRRFTTGLSDTSDSIVGANTDRGYTLHEHMDEVGVIHMNGRIYDPLIGRFMSADPYIQAPDNLQSFNRYAYVLNNPMSLTDPTGYFSFGKLFRTVFAIAVAAFAPEISAYVGWTGGVTASGAAITGGASASLGLSGAVASGTLGGALAGAISTGSVQGAFVGGLTGGAFGGVGDVAPSGIANVAGHAMVGCLSSAASGGSCGAGALSAGAGSMWSNYGAKSGDFAANVAIHAIVGGTASVLGGGKFASGAVTASFGYLFNSLAHAWAGTEATYALADRLNTRDGGGWIVNRGSFWEMWLSGRADLVASDGQTFEIKTNTCLASDACSLAAKKQLDGYIAESDGKLNVGSSYTVFRGAGAVLGYGSVMGVDTVFSYNPSRSAGLVGYDIIDRDNVIDKVWRAYRQKKIAASVSPLPQMVIPVIP